VHFPYPTHEPGQPTDRAARRSGYVLFDVLVALLLLTTTLLGAGAALVQSLVASRAATLQTSAVDLAADLTESLYGTVPRERVIDEWASQAASLLPVGTATASIARESDLDSVSNLDIVIGWRDQGGLSFQLQLPLTLPSPVEPP
jgi:Tfp pilus assembly protein PilV